VALEFETKLIENIAEFRRLESEALLSKFDKSELLDHLREKADTNTKIFSINNYIIEQKIRPMLANLNNTEDVDALFELSQKLYSFNANLDNGLAMEIHKGIIAWAREHKDTDRLLRSLYSIGFIYQQILTLMVARKNHLFFYKEALDAFKEGASYKEIYFEIENKETRRYINRCLGNVYVVYNASKTTSETFSLSEITKLFFENVDAAIGFWNDEKVRAHDPDFPWDAFIGNAHQNVLVWEQALRDRLLPSDIENQKLTERVCESFAFLDENSKSLAISQFWTSSRTENSRRFNRYFRGFISHEELIDDLRESIKTMNYDDYSTDGLFSAFNVPFILLGQLKFSESIKQEQLECETKAILARTIKYFRNIPSGVNRHDSFFVQALSNCAKAVGTFLSAEEYLEILLKFTSFTHLPTYVHTLNVRSLTRVLANYFMKHEPQLFLGICDTKSADDVISKKQEIFELIDMASLCHDIGKVTYLDTVSLHSRRLYDFEFDIIKEHARVETMLEKQNENEIIACVSDVVSGHHKWYDSSRGYISSFDNLSSKYRFIVDMVSISDSIDAATDTVGRSYAQGLSLEQVIKEIKEGSGTRYSPIIAKALDNKTLLSQIQYCVGEGRENAYYEAYLDILGQKEGNVT